MVGAGVKLWYFTANPCNNPDAVKSTRLLEGKNVDQDRINYEKTKLFV